MQRLPFLCKINTNADVQMYVIASIKKRTSSLYNGRHLKELMPMLYAHGTEVFRTDYMSTEPYRFMISRYSVYTYTDLKLRSLLSFCTFIANKSSVKCFDEIFI